MTLPAPDESGRATVAPSEPIDPPAPRASGVLSVPPREATPPVGSQRAQAPVAVQVLDRLGEIAGIVAVTILASQGKIAGEVAVLAILGILGVQTGIRQLGSRGAAGAASVGALGLALWHAAGALEHGARALGLAALAALALGCGPSKAALLAVTPGVPPVSNCAPDAQRCNGAVPEVCSRSGRWWPALPRRADGSPRACPAGCAVEEGVAFCAPADGGAR